MTEALLEALSLKHLARAGWVRVGVSGPESVAAHSWGVGWLVLVLLPDELNLARALSYAILHDLPEVRVGDITPHDGIAASTKHHEEAQAATVFFRSLGTRGERLLQIWRDYESQQDPEARFVKELDRLDMALQAVVYGRLGHATDEFLESAESTIEHPTLRGILEALKSPS